MRAQGGALLALAVAVTALSVLTFRIAYVVGARPIAYVVGIVHMRCSCHHISAGGAGRRGWLRVL